jgi:starch-binding outer membrane protein, SusD/RagB family
MTKKILSMLLISGAAFIHSCTKLNEKVLDEFSVSGLTEKQIAEGALAPVYAKLPVIFQHTNYFALQEISTDEAILPYRGGTDWGDNGIYIALHRHETTSTDPNVRNTWNEITQGMSRAILRLPRLQITKMQMRSCSLQKRGL